jgi:hypothetical protein
MKKLFKTVIVLNLIAGVFAAILRMNFDYFANVDLVDFVAYIGIVFWIVGGAALIGGSSHRSTRMADLAPDYDGENRRFHFTIVMIICGLPSIVTGFILWSIRQ